LASVLNIHLQGDHVTFEMDGHHETLSTKVYLAPGNQERGFLGSGKPREAKILGFGSPPDTPRSLLVHLFARDQVPDAAPDKGDCLAAFMLHGVKLLLDRKFLKLKPEIHVHGIDTLQELMGGYEQYVLRNVLTAAGAKACHFV
jgi:hypothetical protein